MLKNIILILSMTVLFSGCGMINKIKVITLPASWINMNKIAPDIYVNSDMNTTQQKELLTQIPKAKKYVENIWGKVESKPIIYACSTKECAKSLGIGARAYQIYNHIVLSPKALTKELISHEWSHSELYKKVDGYFNWTKVPMWFDEGVAVIVSHEPRHDEKVWKKIQNENIPYPSTNELITIHQWINATYKYQKDLDSNKIVVTYTTAGHIVNQWYKKVGEKGLNKLIEEIKKGNSFDKAYIKSQRL